MEFYPGLRVQDFRRSSGPLTIGELAALVQYRHRRNEADRKAAKGLAG